MESFKKIFKIGKEGLSLSLEMIPKIDAQIEKYKNQIQKLQNKISELMFKQTLESSLEIEKLKREIKGLQDKIAIEEDRKRMILSEYNKKENLI
jgi:phage host-nuclease inhibitor protein Gam